MSEVIEAERAAWHSVSELVTEGKWSLNDSWLKWLTGARSFTQLWPQGPKLLLLPQVMTDAERVCLLHSPYQMRRQKQSPNLSVQASLPMGLSTRKAGRRRPLTVGAFASGSIQAAVGVAKLADTLICARSQTPRVSHVEALTQLPSTKVPHTDPSKALCLCRKEDPVQRIRVLAGQMRQSRLRMRAR